MAEYKFDDGYLDRKLSEERWRLEELKKSAEHDEKAAVDWQELKKLEDSYKTRIVKAKKVVARASQQKDSYGRDPGLWNVPDVRVPVSERLGRLLAAFNVADPYYKSKGVQAKSGEEAATREFLTAYSRNLVQDLKSVFSGKETRTHYRATGSDISRDILKIQNAALQKVTGLGLDIGMDPSTYSNPLKAMGKVGASVGGRTLNIARKVGPVDRSINAVARQFNLMYDLRRSKAADAAEFEKAFTKAVNTGDYTPLKKFGVDIGNFDTRVDPYANGVNIGKAGVPRNQPFGTIQPTKMSPYVMSESEQTVNDASIALRSTQKRVTEFDVAWKNRDAMVKRLSSMNSGLARFWTRRLADITRFFKTGKGRYDIIREAKNIKLADIDELRGKIDSFDSILGPTSKEGRVAGRRNYQAMLDEIDKQKEIIKNTKVIRNTRTPLAASKAGAPYIDNAQGLVDAGWGNPLDQFGLGHILFDPIKSKILQEAFGPKTPLTGIAKGIDWTTSKAKQMLGWSPTWQGGNIIDESINSIAMGARPKDFWGAYKLWKSGGKSNPQLYGDLVERGQIGITGQTEVTLKSIPGWFANMGETITRTATVLNKMRKGSNIDDAVKFANKIHGLYNDKFLTASEKMLRSFIPYYQFIKAQVIRQPFMLTENQGFFAGLTHLQRATTPNSLKRDPSLTPEYLDQTRVGNVAGFRLGKDAFASMLANLQKGDWRAFAGQVLPAGQFADAVATLQDPRTGRDLTKPVAAPQYGGSNPFTKWWVGYNDKTRKAEHPFREWMYSSLFGTVTNTVTKLEDERKSPWERIRNALSPVRPYDTNPSLLRWQKNQNARAAASPPPDTWMNRMAAFLFGGGGTANASGRPPGDPNARISWNGYKMSTGSLDDWATNMGLDPYMSQADVMKQFNSMPLDYMNPADSGRIRMMNEHTGAAMMAAQAYGRGLPVDQQWAGGRLAMANAYDLKAKVTGNKTYKQAAASMRAAAKDTPPDWDTVQNTVMGQWDRGSYAYMKDLKTAQRNWYSAVGQLSSEGEYRGPSRFLNESVSKVNQKKKEAEDVGQTVPEEEYQRAMDIAIRAAQIKATEWEEEITRKTIQNQGKIVETIIDPIDKIVAERESGKSEFLASKEIKELLHRLEYLEGYEGQTEGADPNEIAMIKKRIETGLQVYDNIADNKLRSHFMKTGQEQVGRDKEVIQGQAKEALAILKTAFESNQVGFNAYFRERRAGIDQSSDALMSGQESIMRLAIDPESDARHFLDSMIDLAKSGNLEELQRNQGAIRSVGVDVKAFFDAATEMSEIIMNRSRQIADLSGEEQDAKAKYEAAKAEVESVITGTRERAAGVNPKYTPYAERRAAWVKDFDADTTKQKFAMAKTIGLDLNAPEPTLEGDSEGTLERLDTFREYYDKKNALADFDVERERERAENLKKMDRENWENRVQIASSGVDMLVTLASNLYEASGKQSKEAFFMMKAASVASAIVKGYQAAVAAYASGNELGGPPVGMAFLAISMATTASQIAAIRAQQMAEGGSVRGGSGTRDDVPIMGMGGEYVVKKRSVRKYGEKFMDALNEGLLEPRDFVIPMVPSKERSGPWYAEGGMITPAAPVETTIILENKTGQNMKTTQGGSRFDGKKMVKTLILELADTDPQFASMLGGKR